ncbi:MAG: hypothetical protein HZA89_01225 [Verrucomicrobia bacterium]|nr:hypothetical protein [Verrucomicrobiota bacterium]
MSTPPEQFHVVCDAGRKPLSLAPGFSRVSGPRMRTNRFNGLFGAPAKTVKTVSAEVFASITPLKRGANEKPEAVVSIFAAIRSLEP